MSQGDRHARRQIQRQIRGRVLLGLLVSNLVVIGAFLAMGAVGMAPISLPGLLVLGGVAFFLWRFWSDTLAVVRLLRRRAQEAQGEAGGEAARQDAAPEEAGEQPGG